MRVPIMCEVWTMGELLVEVMRPGPGKPLYERGDFIGPFPSGAPAIFIDTVARLGHSSGIIGGVGEDDFGRCVTDRLKTDGVNCDYVISVAGESTAVAFVTYFEDGSREFIFHIGNTPACKAKSPDMDGIVAPKLFHVMGCSLMANGDFRREIVKTAHKFVEKGARISFDPNIRKELLGGQDVRDLVAPILDYCSVLLPGVEELLMLAGERSIEGSVEKLFESKMLEIIALKKGEKGCSIFSRDARTDLGVYEIVPRDPTGAGDCFDAGFLCGLLEREPIPQCARIASAAAALNTAAFGPMEGSISRKAIEEMIAGAR
jgi:sugar/nucleoside kinase (ribokinase family)